MLSISAPPPNGFLFSYVDTGIHHMADRWTLDDNGDGSYAEFVCSDQYSLFFDRHSTTDFINTISTASTGFTWSFDVSTGKVSVTDSGGNKPNNIKWNSQAGFICGSERKNLVNFTPESSVISTAVPPAAIWLMGAEILEMNLERETRVETHRRGQVLGFHWGGLRTFRWRLTMHKDALKALRVGWALSGKVRLDFSGNNFSINETRHHGYLDAYVIGLNSVSWLGKGAEVAQVELIVAGASDG